MRRWSSWIQCRNIRPSWLSGTYRFGEPSGQRFWRRVNEESHADRQVIATNVGVTRMPVASPATTSRSSSSGVAGLYVPLRMSQARGSTIIMITFGLPKNGEGRQA